MPIKTDDAALRITGMFFHGNMAPIKLTSTLRKMNEFDDQLSKAMVAMDIEDDRLTRIPAMTFNKEGWWRKAEQGWQVVSHAQWSDYRVDRDRGEEKSWAKRIAGSAGEGRGTGKFGGSATDGKGTGKSKGSAVGRREESGRGRYENKMGTSDGVRKFKDRSTKHCRILMDKTMGRWGMIKE